MAKPTAEDLRVAREIVAQVNNTHAHPLERESVLVQSIASMRASEREKAAKVIPTTWLDPMLAGPRAVIGNPPYNCNDIDQVLRAVRKRVAGNKP